MNLEGEIPAVQFSLFNAHGSQVMFQEMEALEFPLRVDFQDVGLPQGVYFCRLQWNQNAETMRLVIK